MISSPTKRLCPSSPSSFIKYHWRPIVDDEYVRFPNVQSMIVAQIKDRRLTSEILSLVNEIYPWTSSLKHIRRIHNSDILLYPPTFSQPIRDDLFEKYFHQPTKLVNVPSTPCLLRWQYEKFIKEHWPNLVFRENPILEQSLLNKDLTTNDQLIFDLLQVRKNKQTSKSN